MKKIIFVVLSLYLAACSPDDKSKGGTTTSASDSASKVCGLNGLYGYCKNVGNPEERGHKSRVVYVDIANCNTLFMKYAEYTALNCGSKPSYELTRSYSMKVVGDSSISRAKEVNLTLLSVTQEFSAAAAAALNERSVQDWELYCDSDDYLTYRSTPKQTKSGIDCFEDHKQSLTNYTVLKVMAGELFVGEVVYSERGEKSCTGFRGVCSSKSERPKVLGSEGVPAWR